MVKFLVQKGADVDIPNNQGQTPLEWATAFGHRDVVKFLEKSSGATTQNGRAASPLAKAADGGDIGQWLEAQAALR